MRSDDILFLATKTLPPRRARGVVARARLNRLSAEVRQRLLTVVKGPPGYGKTTLGLAWSDEIAAPGTRVAWLSLDASDDDVSQCAYYIAATLHRACPGIRRMGHDLLAGLSVAQPERLIALLINDLAEQPDEVFLFIDDCHHLTRPAVHSMLAPLLAHASDNLHLVMLGRSGPPRSLASLVNPEDVLEVDAAALCFDLQETSQLAGRLRRSPLTPADVQALHVTTEGWPAAVRAVLLSLTNHHDPQRYLRRVTGNDQSIAALMEHLLDQLPAELGAFMERISVLDKVCAPLAEALTGEGGGQQKLEQIERLQLFLSPRDTEARWFGFHPLFREQLERRLRRRSADAPPLLHRSAADWFACHNLWSDAVGHALAAGDTGRALGWIEQCAMRLVETGELITLLSWRRQLRAHLLESPLRLRLAFAWALGHAMAGADAARLLDNIERDLESVGADADSLGLECRALRAMVTNVNDDCEGAGRLAQECLAQEPRDTWITNVMLNVVSTSHLKAGRWEEFYAVPPLRLTDENGSGAARYAFNVAYRHCYRGIAEYHQGRLDDAAAQFEQAMHAGGGGAEESALRANMPRGRVIGALPVGLLAQVRYQQGRLDDAAALIAASLELVKIIAPLDFAAAGFLTASRLAGIEGNGVRARALLEEAERLAQLRAWPRMESSMLLERLRLCLIDGRLPEAAACLPRLDALVAASSDAGVNKAYIARDAALAHAWHETICGAAYGVLPRLQRRLEAARTAGLPLEAARLCATLALAHHRVDDRTSALRMMREACECALRCDALRVLFDLPATPRSIRSLLQECAESLPPHSLLAKFALQLADTPRPAEGTPAPSARALENLSNRERHILTLLAKGRSNKEIARALGVAPDTVKYHLKSVFSKLDVRNRVQAAAQAQSYGLS